ncbi:fluoride ion transporter CrcB [Advenella sp. S44]|uniref:fluoride efflux transporter CrcB n=1 Tax=Advenella sp. S44 TaxID=1982755 RepID=UPI000C2AC2A8|nr:fluoride efflux transporter CrcB [Advenella sp. S44]PJX26540.1 fluoride ion transporter CrcB [Advenella sp. S44]
MLQSVFMISVGASCGAILRWILGLAFNNTFHHIAMGTLLANLSGGYLIGVALGIFSAFPALPAEWRLLIVTGFLGGLTTFSSFSAEVTMLLHQGKTQWALLEIGLHLVGSLLMTALGLFTVTAIRRLYG